MPRKPMFALALLMLVMGALAWAGGGKEGAAGATTMSDAAKELAKTWPEFTAHHEAQTACFEQGWTGPEADRDFVTPEIARRTNFLIKYEPVTVATGDDYNQKLNLMVASKEVPEIFFGSSDAYTRDMYEKMGKAGMIWDIAPYIAKYKNIVTLLKPELTLYRAADGKANYWIPTQTGRGNDLLHSAPGGLQVREDFLKRLNLGYPTTPQEFATYLKRSIQEIGTVAGGPVTGLTLDENLSGIEGTLFFPFFPLVLPVNQFINSGLTFDARQNNKVVNYIYSDGPEMMRAAKYASQLYRDGLIDREVISQKRAQFQEKVSSGRNAACVTAWWDMNSWSDVAKATVPELMYVATPPLWDKANGVPKYPDLKWTNWIGCFSSLIVSKKVSEDAMKHFLAVLDYFTTKDGQILTQVGIEGKNFTYDANGHYVFTDEFKKQTGDLDWNKAASYGVYYWQQLVFNLPAFDDIRGEYPELVREDNRKGWENQKYKYDTYVANMDPPKYYYFVEGPIEVQKMPAINSAKSEMFAKVLLAKSDAEVESIIHAWAKSCKDMGIDGIIAERQKYIDNFKL
jgi:putative aldouronate transport system substrate-binding protein